MLTSQERGKRAVPWLKARKCFEDRVTDRGIVLSGSEDEGTAACISKGGGSASEGTLTESGDD